MMSKNLVIGNGSREQLLIYLEEVIQDFREHTIPGLLIFWCSRGGGKTTFLETVSSQLDSLPKVANLGIWDFRIKQYQQIAQEVQEALSKATKDSIKLIGLDNLDALLYQQEDNKTFFDFEREVIQHTLQRDDTIFLATSQAPLRIWHEYETRTRHQNLQIPPLGLKEVFDISSQIGIDCSKVYHLTLGYPEALNWLQTDPNLNEREISQRMTNFLLEPLSEQAHAMAEVASLFPVFNVRVIQLAQKQESIGSSLSYIELIGEMAKMGLVLWEINVGYRFSENTVRIQMARNFQFGKPDEFYRIHQKAAEYYQEEARRSSYLHTSLVSAIYHLAQANSKNGSEWAGMRCVEWVQKNAETWWGANWEMVLHAWQTGLQVESLVDELKSLLGSSHYDRITQILQTTRHLMEVPA